MEDKKEIEINGLVADGELKIVQRILDVHKARRKRIVVVFHLSMLSAEFAETFIPDCTDNVGYLEFLSSIYDLFRAMAMEVTGEIMLTGYGTFIGVFKNYTDRHRQMLFASIEEQLVQYDLWAAEYGMVVNTPAVATYILPSDFDAAYKEAKRIENTHMAIADLEKKIKQEHKRQEHFVPIVHKQLTRLFNGINSSEISNLVNRQNISMLSVTDIYSPLPLYTHYTVSINDMCDIMLPNTNIQHNPFLFRYIGRVLDLAMLKAIQGSNLLSGIAHPPSFNLNITTLTYDDTLDIIQKCMASASIDTVGIEIDLVDLIEHQHIFNQIRSDYIRAGVIFILKGVLIDELPLINLKQLGLHLLKVRSTDLLSIDTERENVEKLENLTALIHDIGPNSCILTHVETIGQFWRGVNMGICMMQGYYLDLMANANKTSK